MDRARIAIGMSGGTDSSMAAHILVEQGADVHGVTFRLWHESSATSSSVHVERARSVAAKLGIPHTVIDIHAPFLEQIVHPFVASYLAGTTPSPCVRCNQLIKFGIMLQQTHELGCDKLATGHYAKAVPSPLGGGALLRGDDPTKDQSYFLAGLTREQLGRAVFPLGALTKADVKEKAATLGLAPKSLAESQDLCFVPDGDCAAFIERLAGKNVPDGEITDVAGHVLGQHGGIHRFTVGQRRGLGLGGGPWYVVSLDSARNRVVVGPRQALFVRGVSVVEMNWLVARPEPGIGIPVLAQLRYNMTAAPARVDPGNGGTARVEFDEPVYAVTPGQFAVFYQGDTVLGGGWIKGAIEPSAEHGDTAA